jgi:hypothetical protein
MHNVMIGASFHKKAILSGMGSQAPREKGGSKIDILYLALLK